MGNLVKLYSADPRSRSAASLVTIAGLVLTVIPTGSPGLMPERSGVVHQGRSTVGEIISE